MNVERPIDPIAEAALPPGSDARGDIDDEIGDHLALAARDLQLAGHANDEARQLALAKFGDVDQIRRKCWWIQQGDAVMARAALGLAIAVLILAVVGLAVGGWRMNSAINDLGDTLAAINESQKSLVDSQKQVNRPLVIRGRLYIGDKSKPADYAEVHLYRLPEAKLIERISADNEGRFITPPLEAGSYFLVAPLVGELNPSVYHAETIKDYVPLFVVQSAPISVFPWAELKEVELDLAMIGVGQISYELTEPLPGEIPLRIPAKRNGDGLRSISSAPRRQANDFEMEAGFWRHWLWCFLKMAPNTSRCATFGRESRMIGRGLASMATTCGTQTSSLEKIRILARSCQTRRSCLNRSEAPVTRPRFARASIELGHSCSCEPIRRSVHLAVMLRR